MEVLEGFLNSVEESVCEYPATPQVVNFLRSNILLRIVRT